MMDLLLKLGDLLAAIGDPLLGWMLLLPRDVALIILAIMTGIILTVVRVWTTNQDLLKRTKEDKARIKELIGEAKRNQDKEAIKRYRATDGQLGLICMKAEGWPLLASLVPIAIIACWAFARIGYLPPAPGEATKVEFFFLDGEIGKTIFMLPEPGVTVKDGLVRRIEPSYALDGKTIDGGMATWLVKAEPRPEPYLLRFRYQGRQIERKFIADGRKAADFQTFYPEVETIICSQLALKQYKPAGFVPGIPALLLDPWIVGYLIIVIPLSLVLKPVMKIY